MSRPVLLLCLLACGGENPIVSDAGVPAPDNGDEVELAPYAGWPQEVAARRVGDTQETTVSQLELDGRGGVWLLRVEWRAPHQSAPVLERYGATGRRDRRVVFDDGVRVRGFVVHPSGQLTVFRLAGADASSSRLDLLRLSPDGEVLDVHAFTDTAGPRENLCYYERDGYLTHTEEAGRHNQGMLGATRLGL